MRFISLLLFPLVVFAEDSATSGDPIATGSLPASTEASSVSTTKQPIPTPEEGLSRRSAALTALRSGNEADVKTQLNDLSATPAGNPAKSFALATNLLRLAFKARSVGDPAAAMRAAQLAWDELTVAEKEFGKVPRRLAMIQSARATLLEEFLGTEEQALDYYQKVIELEPANAGVREKLDRSTSRSSAADGLGQPAAQTAESTKNETVETR